MGDDLRPIWTEDAIEGAAVGRQWELGDLQPRAKIPDERSLRFRFFLAVLGDHQQLATRSKSSDGHHRFEVGGETALSFSRGHVDHDNGIPQAQVSHRHQSHLLAIAAESNPNRIQVAYHGAVLAPAQNEPVRASNSNGPPAAARAEDQSGRTGEARRHPPL